MAETTHTPDSPFRCGISGKYKLLIKDIFRRFDGWEYELVDAENNIYYAKSKKHYPHNQVLRCMVTLRVESAKLVLDNTTICSRQDLTSEMTDEFVNIEGITAKKGGKIKDLPHEGSPSLVGHTGKYRLSVDDVREWDGVVKARFMYVLHDDNGHQYQAISNINYPIGKKIICRVEVYKEKGGNIFFVAICDDESSSPVGEVDGIVIPRHYYTVSPVPTRMPRKQLKSRDNQKKKKETSATSQSIFISATKYEKRERYIFIVTSESDGFGHQIVEDESGCKHLLTGTNTHYSEGDKVRCTVKGFGNKPVGTITSRYLVLSEPRIIHAESITVRLPYVKSPDKWFAEVGELGRHKCGKPFTCSCCKKRFPANAGWRVDLKEIYFCNACAKNIYEPQGRGNHHFIIYTPMGNKR